MKRKIVLCLFFLAAAASAVIFTAKNVCAYTMQNLQLRGVTGCELRSAESLALDATKTRERDQRIKELTGRTRNFSVVLTRSEGSRILENIKLQRTRAVTLSDKSDRDLTAAKLSEQSASAIHQFQFTEIQQDINQRK